MPNSEPKIIEPLAKFHAKVSTKGRVAIPKETRALYELEYGDYLGLIIRKINPFTKLPEKRAFLVVKLSSSGQIVVPKSLIENLNLEIGEIIEVLLIGIIKTREILSQANVPEEYKEWILKKGFMPLSEVEEHEFIWRFTHRPYISQM